MEGHATAETLDVTLDVTLNVTSCAPVCVNVNMSSTSGDRPTGHPVCRQVHGLCPRQGNRFLDSRIFPIRIHLQIATMTTATSRYSGTYEPISLSEHAYIVIRDRILKCELKLGAPLSRRKLAAELNMSLLPLSEALQRLESEGLVESRPRVGTRVCQPNAEDIRERYEVREALEAQAARLFAEKSSARERGELRDLAARMDEMFNRCVASGTKDADTLYDVHSFHTGFHLRIAECTGCRLLCQAIEKNHVLIFNWMYDVAAERPPLPPRFHHDLMEALCSSDPEAADRAMRHHVRYGLDNVLRGIRPAEDKTGRPEILQGGGVAKPALRARSSSFARAR